MTHIGRWIETGTNEFVIQVTDRVDIGVYLNHKGKWRWCITANGLTRGTGESKEDAQRKAANKLADVFTEWQRRAIEVSDSLNEAQP